MDDIKFGITIYPSDKEYRWVGACLCGQHNLWTARFQADKTCEKCGNKYFVDCGNSNVVKGKRTSLPYLNLIHKSDKGFKVEKTNISVIYKEGQLNIIQKNLTRTMDFDYVNKSLKVYRDDVLEYDSRNDENNYVLRMVDTRFFKFLEVEQFIDFISTDRTRELYTYINGKLCRDGNRKSKFMLGLKKFLHPSYTWIQILVNAGLTNVARFEGGYYRTSLNKSATKPHEILKVPKFMISVLREDDTITMRDLSNFHPYFNEKDNNKIREIISIVKDEGSIQQLSQAMERIMILHKEYGYNNLKKLILYLFRETKLYQGIADAYSSATYLRDYVRMSNTLGLEYEKYPKSLKKEHDIVSLNYNLVNKGERDNIEFSASVNKETYQGLKYKNRKDKYLVTIPETPKDLMKEGNQLSHCVASYVKDVVSDKCKILFLRHKDDPEKPLVTIEVRGKNVRQVKGRANRSATVEEKEFIAKWAEERDLFINYY